ncbi:MAG: hypothetical protein KGL39_34105 [Patescibacteria group bacterium]|nr:hypothetical protein [Patescibacteria group bacterium]
MIHYNQLKKKAAKLADGEHLILRVSKMIATGRDRDGNPKPPQVPNDSLVKVLAVHADSVEVETEAGKKVVFSHALGADKLELTPMRGFPKAERQQQQQQPQQPPPPDGK